MGIYGKCCVSRIHLHYLQSLFFEKGLLAKLLTDNNTEFYSKLFKGFLNEVGTHLWFHYVYVPWGHSILERCHQSIKLLLPGDNGDSLLAQHHAKRQYITLNCTHQ